MDQEQYRKPMNVMASAMDEMLKKKGIRNQVDICLRYDMPMQLVVWASRASTLERPWMYRQYVKPSDLASREAQISFLDEAVDKIIQAMPEPHAVKAGE